MPLTKIKDGIKKTTKQVEEEILKATEHVKNKFESDRTTGLKQKIMVKKAAATKGDSSDDNTSSTPEMLATQVSSSDGGVTSDASKESSGVGGDGSSSNIISDTIIDKDEESSTSNHTDHSSSATDTSSSAMRVFIELFIITIISISTVYHTWWYREEIASNQIPFIVSAHWALLTYSIGRSSTTSTNEKIVFVSIDNNDDITVYEKDASTQESVVVTRSSFTKEEQEQTGTDSITKQIIGRIPKAPRRHYSKMKSAYLNNLNYREKKKRMMIITRKESVEEFFTNLKPVGGFTTTKNGPISAGMMQKLLKFSPDFRRRKSVRGEIDMMQMMELESCLQDEEEDQKEEKVMKEEEGDGDGELSYEMGTAPLINLRASKLERDFDYVEPLCKFRGMDMFVGDFPEKEIWKQPLLLKNGLRDKPTLIGNMMIPHGNLVTYLQMPDWFDDWDNIPEETEDDPPDIKAFKRFFAGDLEYQRRRAKILPMVVKAPYVVKMISPDPSEMTIHTPRHPVSIKKVNKVVDPETGETTAAAVMEVGVDFYTSAAIARIINIVMPHLGSITIDVAMVIHPPWGATGAEAEEPSACLGVWRIDQVDFLKCAQLPEKPIEVVEEEIKEIMKSLTDESDY